MARTVDPERHEARRLAIIDAGLTRFAADGFDRATTAAICAEAGIGSGTFFHYFPTKLSLLLAILEYGTRETRAWFAAQSAPMQPLAVVLAYVRHSADEFADPRMPGFVRSVGAVMAEPEVAAALAADAAALLDGLTPWLSAAQEGGEVRNDLAPERLAQWVAVVLDGFLGRLAEPGPAFHADTEQEMLVDSVRRVLAP